MKGEVAISTTAVIHRSRWNHEVAAPIRDHSPLAMAGVRVRVRVRVRVE
jgi:hypothetical protein